MILLKNCSIPGIAGTGWTNNRMEIKEIGGTLHTYHNIPESVHIAFRNGKISLQELDKTYHPDIKHVLG